MSRFLVFTGARYYPLGGSSDLRGAASSFDAAKQIALDNKDEWMEVFDMIIGLVVWSANLENGKIVNEKINETRVAQDSK